MTKARNHSSKWNGKLYFVYLPAVYDYDKDPLREKVLGLVELLDIPIIDIYHEVFANHPNPLELFPFEKQNHFTEKGYNLVASAIIKKINKLENPNKRLAD